MLVRIFKHFRQTQGARVYIRLIRLAWMELKDFALFYAVVTLCLALSVFTIWSASGGNYKFGSFGESIARTVEFTFGYLDKDAFINNGLGVGSAVALIVTAFWVSRQLHSVVLLFFSPQNKNRTLFLSFVAFLCIGCNRDLLVGTLYIIEVHV
jgi:hypothetical protein